MDRYSARAVGDYILGRKIGSGSFAVVWRARHRVSSVQFAVKEIDKSRLSPKISDNLLKEISILSTINHPNIIRLFESIQTEDKIFLVLEYCDGGDLAAYINRHGKVSEAVARHFMRQIAAGLQVLHEKHLIHRDLKPQNLLLSSHERTPQLKIGDFGFARSLKPQNLADTLCGSPLYMAPEIIQNHKYDAKADLWSVGAILFQLVTGKLPFHGNTQYQLFQNVLASTELQFPEGALQDLHPDCLDLCRSLLHQNPVERISFMEFFNHKFLREPRVTVDVDQFSLPQELKPVVQQLDFSASHEMSQLHSEHLIRSAKGNAMLTSSSVHNIVEHGNIHGGSSGNRNVRGPMPYTAHDRIAKTTDGNQYLSERTSVADSLESIEKDYVIVNRHCASTDNMSYYSDRSLQGNSTAAVSVYPPKKNDPDMQKKQHGSSNANAEKTVTCRSDPMSTTCAPISSGKVQRETTLHPPARLHLLHQYARAVGELALEKYNAGKYLESFSVELVVLAIWKKVLRICSSWLSSTAGDNICSKVSANKSTLDLGEPSSACKWAEQEFVSAYDHAEKLSHNVQHMDAATEMPDAMEIIYRKALNYGTSGAVDEYMKNKDNAARLYSKAMLLLSFIVEEATSIPINPPFVLTDANKKQIQIYIVNLQFRLSHFK